MKHQSWQLNRSWQISSTSGTGRSITWSRLDLHRINHLVQNHLRQCIAWTDLLNFFNIPFTIGEQGRASLIHRYRNHTGSTLSAQVQACNERNNEWVYYFQLDWSWDAISLFALIWFINICVNVTFQVSLEIACTKSEFNQKELTAYFGD